MNNILKCQVWSLKPKIGVRVVEIVGNIRSYTREQCCKDPRFSSFKQKQRAHYLQTLHLILMCAQISKVVLEE